MAGRESNFSAVTGPEAQGECRSAIDAMKQSPLYNCRCRRGMKKEKNCLRIFWSIFQSLQGMFGSLTFSVLEGLCADQGLNLISFTQRRRNMFKSSLFLNSISILGI